MAQFIIVLICSLFFSCSSTTKSNSDKLFLPDSLIAYNTNSPILRTKYKIITHIDLSCLVCWEELFMWNDLLNESIISNEVSLHFYVYSMDRITTERKLSNIEELSTRCQVIFDEQSKYLENNKELIMKFKTFSFVVDSSMNVILYGSPLHDKELMEKYLNLFK